jgi:hypothetical protein
MERILAQNLLVRREDRGRLCRLIIFYIIWESHPAQQGWQVEPNEISGAGRLRPGTTGEIDQPSHAPFKSYGFQAAALGVPNAYRNHSKQDHRLEAASAAK